jgi:hypothetical protein
MPYAFQDGLIGLPGMRAVDTAPRSPAIPGMLTHAVHAVNGGGEFVYLQGVANVVTGSLVTYDQSGGTALAVATAHGSPVAVAMAAIGAGQYGWFQVAGRAYIAKTATAAAVGQGVGVSATAGQGDAVALISPLASGTLSGAVVAAAALTTDATVICEISRPMIA